MLSLRWRRRALLALALGAAFASGLATGHGRIIPTSPFRFAVLRMRLAVGDSEFDLPEARQAPMRVEALRRVATPAAALERRQRLLRLLWAADSLPPRLPDEVRTNVAPRLAELAAGRPVEELVTRMPNGVDSRVALIRAGGHAPCLMVYQEGHDGALANGAPYVHALLRAGCDVLALEMPLLGGNARPLVRDSSFGEVRLTQHDHLQLVDAPEFPLPRYFLEPVLASLNFALARRSYERVGMMGLSGGGWTTAVYAALDPRITRSYQVAGTEPVFTRTLRPVPWGDAEQLYMPMLRIAGYSELYVLATTGGRRQLVVVNRFDPCCFGGSYYRLYEPAVAKVAQAQGGSFRVLRDDTHATHVISDVALDSILADFQR